MAMLLAILFVGIVAYLMTQRQYERSQMPTQHFGIADPALPPGIGWRHLVTRVVAGVTAAPKANGPEDGTWAGTPWTGVWPSTGYGG